MWLSVFVCSRNSAPCLKEQPALSRPLIRGPDIYEAARAAGQQAGAGSWQGRLLSHRSAGLRDPS